MFDEYSELLQERIAALEAGGPPEVGDTLRELLALALSTNPTGSYIPISNG